MKTQYLAPRKLMLAALVVAAPFQIFAQLSISPNKTAAQLANAMVGPGVTVSNATLTCRDSANGTFSGGANPLGISNGIILTSGMATFAVNAASFFSSENNNTAGDANLSALSGNQTFDACVLQFDFIPLGDSIKFDYQFGSEEYPSFTCTQFNDVFGFFISGPGYAVPTNIALVPGTNIPVAINSVNGGTPTGAGVLSNCTGMGPGSPFSQYFINNVNGPAPVYDGLTMVFSAKAAVTPCETYHFKLGVADASDRILTSGVFIEEGSLTVLPPAIVGCPSNISVNTGATATTCSAQATWTPPTADNSCLDVTVSSTHNPGDMFPVGTTTVTYSFTNIGGTSNCSFDVTVVDNTVPTAVCQNYTLNLVNGMGTVTPANIDNGSSDNCGIDSMSVSPSSFTCEDAGGNLVTLTVTDLYGNVSTCTATVTVQYQPTCSIVSVPENNVYTGGNPNNIYLGYGPQTATLNATATGGSGFTYSWSPSTNLSCSNCEDPVFSPTAGGTYTFTLTATNSNGCSTTCDITFCVLDIRDPNHPNKVFMCHNPSNPQTISISVNAVPSHFPGHVGELLGKCTDKQCGTGAKGSYTDNGPAAVQTVSEIGVYPNPVTGILTIELPAGTTGEEAVLLDIAGRKLQTKSFDGSSKLSFDMTREAKGVYIVEVVNGTSVYRSRIVKE